MRWGGLERPGAWRCWRDGGMRSMPHDWDWFLVMTAPGACRCSRLDEAEEDEEDEE